jgi:cellulose synthase/poly-beta-1,6-N-acetylglucosamine synthase-like glycosyltransferase
LFAAVLLPILLVWILVNLYIYYPVCRMVCRRKLTDYRVRLQRLRADTGDATRNGERSRPAVRTTGDEVLRDDQLPTMGVLLPAYEESAVIEQSIDSVLNASYPSSKLELYVLTEPDDEDTPTVLDPLSEQYSFTIITVPSAYPDEATKPRALNYGFEYSDEDIVCVIDAEDIVAPDLFRLAASEMVAGDLDYAQARLDMVNEDDGWLNLMFRADYAYWFRSVLPAFADAGYPMPLGGTSNFFRRSTLEEMHGLRMAEYGDSWTRSDCDWVTGHGMAGFRPWDPQNVTEDFELGLFLWKEHKEFAYIDIETSEESPLTLDGWIRQRTRWKKGKLYTYLQYRETPPEQWRAKFHFFLQSMLPHTGPINIAGVVITLMLANFASFGPGALLTGGEFVGLGFVLLATWFHAQGYWRVSEKPPLLRLQRAIRVALTLPFYWLLQWGADIRALYQTYNGQLDDWELTEHFGRNNTAESTGVETTGGSIRPEISSTDVTPVELFGYTRTIVLLSGITLSGAALRLFNLTEWSLSGSELHWLGRASGPLPTLFIMPGDPQPPLYAIVLRAWLSVAGTDDVALRLLSVVFSVLAILALFALGRALYTNATGLVAAGLFAIGMAQVHFARVVGPHAMTVVLMTVSWYFFTKLATDDRLAGLGYAVTTAALLYTHLVGIALLLTQWAYAGLSEGAPSLQNTRIRTHLGITTVVSAPVLGNAAVQSFTRQHLQSSLAYGWLPQLSLTQIRTTILALAGHPAMYPLTAGNILTWAVASAVITIFVFSGIFSVFTFRREDSLRFAIVDQSQAAGLLSLLLALLLVPFLCSLLTPSVFVPRYTFVATIPLYLLVARGLTNLDERYLRLALAVSLVLAGSVFGAFYVSSPTQEDWRGATQQVELSADSGDLVIFQPTVASSGFDHYYAGPAVETVTLPHSTEIDESRLRDLREQVSGHRQIWVLRYRDRGTGPAMGLLEDERGPVTVSNHGVVRVYRFGPADS